MFCTNRKRKLGEPSGKPRTNRFSLRPQRDNREIGPGSKTNQHSEGKHESRAAPGLLILHLRASFAVRKRRSLKRCESHHSPLHVTIHPRRYLFRQHYRRSYKTTTCDLKLAGMLKKKGN